MKKVNLIKEHLLAAQANKRYTLIDNRRCDLEYQFGDYVFLKVFPTKMLQRFGMHDKLSLRFIGLRELGM